MNQNFQAKICVIGAGAFGTALAVTQALAGRKVSLWCRSEAQMKAMRAARRNERYLPGIAFPDALDLAEDIPKADIYLWAVPAQAFSESLQAAKPSVDETASIVICAKGLDAKSGKRLSEIVALCGLDNPVAVLSGPAFAADLAEGRPTAVTIASQNGALKLCRQLSTNRLRCYASDDVAGVELGGALKNVLAIAAGVAIGAGFGESARAALVTRGFAELCRLAEANNARPETLMGLSGLGDLMLTTASAQSRNTAYGMALGAEKDLPTELAEGAKTAPVALQLARNAEIDVPIIEKTVALLEGSTTVQEAMTALLARDVKAES